MHYEPATLCLRTLCASSCLRENRGEERDLARFGRRARRDSSASSFAALGMLSQRPPRSCKACVQALRPLPAQRPPPSRRAFASTSHLLSTPPSSPTPPFSSSTPPCGAHSSPLEAARTQAQKQLTSVLSTLNLSARARARVFSSALAALELERKLGQAGAKINKATGYEEIERLRKGVAERGAECRVRVLDWALTGLYGNREGAVGGSGACWAVEEGVHGGRGAQRRIAARGQRLASAQVNLVVGRRDEVGLRAGGRNSMILIMSVCKVHGAGAAGSRE